MFDNFFKNVCFGFALTALAFATHANAQAKTNPLLEKLETLSQSKLVQTTLNNSNKQYKKYSPQQKRALSREYKKELRSKNQPFIAHLTENSATKKLKQFQKVNPQVLGALLTNKSAYTVAQTFNPKSLRQYFTKSLMRKQNPKTNISKRARSPFKGTKTTRVMLPVMQGKKPIGSLVVYTRR